jgi:hypothetical protein
VEKMIFKSKKGFLFTLGAILFATTLVVYSQTYLFMNYSNEKNILSISGVSALKNIDDSIAKNLIKIVGVGLDVNCGSDLNIHFYEKVPKGYDVFQKMIDFENMLNNEYFKRAPGEQEFDMSQLKDGVAEVFIGEKVTIESDYSNKITKVYPNSSNSLLLIDLNIYIDGLAQVPTFNPDETGDATLILNYRDENSLTSDISYSTNNFNPANVSSLLLNFSDGNVLFLIGNTEGVSNSFYLDSNIDSNIFYSLQLNYSECADYLPIRLNANLEQSLGKVTSNTLLKIIN